MFVCVDTKLIKASPLFGAKNKISPSGILKLGGFTEHILLSLSPFKTCFLIVIILVARLYVMAHIYIHTMLCSSLTPPTHTLIAVRQSAVLTVWVQ